MITSKITKLGLAVAVLGLGILAACSDDNVASSFSETQGVRRRRWRARGAVPGFCGICRVCRRFCMT